MSPAKGRLFHPSLVLEGFWPMTYSCMATLGSLLKGPGQILRPPFLFPATWNGDIMAGIQHLFWALRGPTQLEPCAGMVGQQNGRFSPSPF